MEKRAGQRLAATSPTLPLDGYTGTYESDLYGTAEIRRSGKNLLLQLGPRLVAEVSHWQQDAFEAKFGRPALGAHGLLKFKVDDR